MPHSRLGRGVSIKDNKQKNDATFTFGPWREHQAVVWNGGVVAAEVVAKHCKADCKADYSCSTCSMAIVHVLWP